MEEKEILRIDEAVKHVKDWMKFLECHGWDTVQMDCFYYDKLYACLKLMIRYIDWKRGVK